jgi:hypothetical protein
VDITPLVAGTLAVWFARTQPLDGDAVWSFTAEELAGTRSIRVMSDARTRPDCRLSRCFDRDARRTFQLYAGRPLRRSYRDRLTT